MGISIFLARYLEFINEKPNKIYMMNCGNIALILNIGLPFGGHSSLPGEFSHHILSQRNTGVGSGSASGYISGSDARGYLSGSEIRGYASGSDIPPTPGSGSITLPGSLEGKCLL